MKQQRQTQIPPSESRTLGPVSDLERHLPSEWWRSLFNSLYLKTDGDVVENDLNTTLEVDLLIKTLDLEHSDHILDLCCGQGRHALELANRDFMHVTGIDRSRHLIRLAKKRAQKRGLNLRLSEGDARKFKITESSLDCIFLMGNSFGYFEHQEDDIKVLNAIIRALKPYGKLALDITDGAWMRTHFEPRSWEWIDQNQFVCRERSLSQDKTRIISREVIVHAEKGVIADQFYAERLYDSEQITALLNTLKFENIKIHQNLKANSKRGQDLGMMANRLFISMQTPDKPILTIPKKMPIQEVTVLLGDPSMPDVVKPNGMFNQNDLETVTRLKNSLEKLTHYKFQFLDDHENLLTDLRKKPPKFVFNLCDEGYYNHAEMELHIPALLNMVHVPYSGADPSCLAICYNKSVIRAIAIDLDIPVPEETYYNPSDISASIPSIFPAILKPNYGDSSIGITQDSVVKNSEQLIQALERFREILPKQPILVQSFLEGKEYSVTVIGNHGNYKTLPILEVDYSNIPEGLPHILGYESKWIPSSPYWDVHYQETVLDEESKRKLADYSIKLFERTNCKDYARFDFRTDCHGVIKLLEVNPNPGWCWDGKMNLMANFAGLSYVELLDLILKTSLERYDLSAA